MPPDPSEPCDGSRAQGKQSKQGSGDGPSEPPKNCPRFIPQGKAHFWLVFTMVLESTNLISGMLYCLEGYQRAAVADLHVECGSATLIPVLPEQCPDSLSHLPACDLGMANLALCEADPEDRSTMCPVSVEIDNCGKFDVYQVVVEPACAEIGCEILTKALWAFAFTFLRRYHQCYEPLSHSKSVERIERESRNASLTRHSSGCPSLAILHWYGIWS